MPLNALFKRSKALTPFSGTTLLKTKDNANA